jgi:hypothetical protein
MAYQELISAANDASGWSSSAKSTLGATARTHVVPFGIHVI